MLITEQKIKVLGKYFVQGLDKTTIYPEKIYSINFTEIVYACTIMEETIIYLLIVQKFINLKQKFLRLR